MATDKPAPLRDSLEADPAASDGARKLVGRLRRRLADGTWVGSLICLPFLAAFVFLGVKAAHQHHWAKLAGFIVIAAALLTVLAGGPTWRRRILARRGNASP